MIKPGEKVGCVISGGNIGMQRYASLIAEPEEPASIKAAEQSTSVVSTSTCASNSGPSSPRSDSSKLSALSSDKADSITTEDMKAPSDEDGESNL